MGKVYAELDERLRNFIARQPVFFVATAPSVTADGDGGHVNVSPKGYRDTFAVLDPDARAAGAPPVSFSPGAAWSPADQARYRRRTAERHGTSRPR
jgi:hypothetical protein